jgi:transketolase C-terminal domain/subunit
MERAIDRYLQSLCPGDTYENKALWWVIQKLTTPCFMRIAKRHGPFCNF